MTGKQTMDLRCEQCGVQIDDINDHLFVGREDQSLVLCVRHGRGRKDVEFWARAETFVDWRYGPEKFGMHRR